jgi:Ca2+-binding EF-hand superfamily protein
VNEGLPFDTLAEFIIDTVLNLQNQKLENLRDIFNAADLNGNGVMDFDEIKILSSLLQSSKTPTKLKKIFESFSENGEMSFQNFEKMCLNNDLFTIRSQIRLIPKSLRNSK